ncbi:heterokaryon incompatibility protein-domain-containing protein [Chaetomium strumarium]|uniref:Heterokaryon incompatibility protein-domain-containing protein n=1 Tax=Chaetomium strumarium TaxID=1170767 RepID=A0AAJ0GRK0_9PEZI|nr:heterokaryon incompatibility protein-domain-containing protein [Chaetomium strumarium]
MDKPRDIPALLWWYPASPVCAHGVWGEKLEKVRCSPLPAFRESSGKGCAACMMILEAIDEFCPGWTSHAIENKKIYLYYGFGSLRTEHSEMGSEPFALYLSASAGGRQSLESLDHNMSFQLVYQTADEHLFRPGYCGRAYGYDHDLLRSSLRIVEDTRSNVAFDRIARWLAHCLETDKCCGIPDSQFKPKRLIYVGLPPEDQNNLRLVESKDPAVYACLSYCWGTDVDGVLTTTEENLSTHMKHIDETALPKSVADAVIVCRNIGIPHLWVDSLCIVQDSSEDWAQQSSVMGEIYARSLLTIYAKAADSCKSGFLGPQRYGRPSWQRPLKTQVPASLGRVSKDRWPKSWEFLEHGESSRLFIRKGTPNFDRSNFPLDTRGWAMQESLLPSRKLIFTGNEMVWECLARTTCECGHQCGAKVLNGAPSDGIKYAVGLSSQDRWANGQEHKVSHLTIVRDWQNMVKEYSLRQLTRAEDKLAAISGLATMTRDAISAVTDGKRDRYYAGLWGSRLSLDLTWWMPDGGTRPARYRAPTWSWASIDGRMAGPLNGPPNDSSYMTHIARNVKICDVWCQPEDELNPTGRLADGFVRLRGPVVRGPFRMKGRSHNPPRDRDRNCRVWLDCRDAGSSELEEAILSRCYNREEFGTRSLMILRSCTGRLGTALLQTLTKLMRPLTKLVIGLWNRFFEDRDAEYACIQLVTWNRDGEGKRFARFAKNPRIGHAIPPVSCFLVLQRQHGEDDVYTRVGMGFCTAVKRCGDASRKSGSEPPERKPLLFSHRAPTEWEFPLFRNCDQRLIKIV